MKLYASNSRTVTYRFRRTVSWRGKRFTISHCRQVAVVYFPAGTVYFSAAINPWWSTPNVNYEGRA